MTKLLIIDEMLDVLSNIQHPKFSDIRTSVERLADQIGEVVADALGVECGAASYEGSDFGGTCVAFYAPKQGRPCPEPLRAFDSTEWSDLDGNDLDPETGEVLA